MKNRPPLDFDLSGWASRGEYRFRDKWFWHVVEELYEHKSGKLKWGKISKSVSLCIIPHGPYGEANKDLSISQGRKGYCG